MRYLCTNCRYIYDEWMGEKSDSIEPGTRYDADFSCPWCDEYDSFHEITEEVNMIDETNDEQPLELEHVPVLHTLPDGILEIRVWRHAHPMWSDHRISTIALYDEYGDMVEEKFLDEDEIACVQFDISNLDEYEIRIRCSIHGTWGMKIEK